MAKQWRMVRLEIRLAEAIDREIERLVLAYEEKHKDVAVKLSASGKEGHKGITRSDFIKRLLRDYLLTRKRKDDYAARQKEKRKKAE